MRVRTLIATKDNQYTQLISEYIAERHADTIEISTCNNSQQLKAKMKERKYDAVLADNEMIKHLDLKAVKLTMLLHSGRTEEGDAADISDLPASVMSIKKHKRISSTVARILEQYASVTGNDYLPGEQTGAITAVWSPSGGSGTTTVALSYAASKMIKNYDVFYLSLESFSSVHAYFHDTGKSISSVLEMLESGDGNVNMLMQGVSVREDGIKYLCAPNNYEDISILTSGNIKELINHCAQITGEVVVDLSCVCDAKTRQVFEMADKVLLVTDSSNTAGVKLEQFISQSNIFGNIHSKTTLVWNKEVPLTEALSGRSKTAQAFEDVIFLPQIDSESEKFIYKALAKDGFQTKREGAGK